MRFATVAAVAALCGPVLAQDKNEVQKLRAEVAALRAEVKELKAELVAVRAVIESAGEVVATAEMAAEERVRTMASVTWTHRQCIDVVSATQQDRHHLVAWQMKRPRSTAAQRRRNAYVQGLFDSAGSAASDGARAIGFGDQEECQRRMMACYEAWNAGRREIGITTPVKYGEILPEHRKKIEEDRKRWRR